MTNPVSPLEVRRRQLGLTQAELGRQVRIDRAEVSRFERGLRPPPTVRDRIAEALDVPPGDLWPQPTP